MPVLWWPPRVRTQGRMNMSTSCFPRDSSMSFPVCIVNYSQQRPSTNVKLSPKGGDWSPKGILAKEHDLILSVFPHIIKTKCSALKTGKNQSCAQLSFLKHCCICFNPLLYFLTHCCVFWNTFLNCCCVFTLWTTVLHNLIYPQSQTFGKIRWQWLGWKLRPLYSLFLI